MNIENKSIEELKVIAYDLLASQEQTQKNLQIVNQMIAKKYEDAKMHQEQDAKEQLSVEKPTPPPTQTINEGQ